MVDTQVLYDIRQHDAGPWGAMLFFLALSVNAIWVSRTGKRHPHSWCGRVLELARNGSPASAWVWRHPNMVAGFCLLFVLPLPFTMASHFSHALDIQQGNYETYAGTLDSNVLVDVKGQQTLTEDDQLAVGPLRFYVRCDKQLRDVRRPGGRGACVRAQLGDHHNVDYKSLTSGDGIRVLRIWR